MFFYEQQIPAQGSIVIANMKVDDKNDNCMYVTLPEYGNIEGILYRNELPKRLKLQKKAIADMKQAGQIVCIVTNTTATSSTDANLIELSIKGVDAKYHELILTRYRNIEKILKLMKFISVKFDIPFYELIKELQQFVIVPLHDIDEDNGIDNFEILYASCLRDIESFLKFVPLVNDIKTEVIETLHSLIRETNASSSIMFDIFVWKGDSTEQIGNSTGRNAVTILQSFFSDIKTKFTDKTVDIRYIGAPRYQICIRSVALNDIDDIYTDIKTSMIDWMTNNNITSYDLQFDTTQKEVVHGDVAITFPFHIDMSS